MSMTHTEPLRAVLYLRLSAIVDDSTSIVRQQNDLQALADREDWEVVSILVDEGISGRKARKNAAEAVRMIREEEADVLAVWKLDRFTRQGWDGLGELSRALDARAEKARKREAPPAKFVALQDGLTSEQASFRLIAGVLSEVARTEADNTATRARSAIEYRKLTARKFTGGSSVPFGYRSEPAPDGVGRVLVHNEIEAPVVREVADRILSREESLSAIAQDLNDRKLPTSKSPARRAMLKGEPDYGLERGTWRTSTIRNYWTSDTLLGRVVHHEDFIRDESGLPATVWPPILDRSQIDAIRERLSWTPPKTARKRLNWTGEPSRVTPKRAARLLSGVAFCAVCGTRMFVTTSGGRPIYACASSWNGDKCVSPKINAVGLDDFVSSRFLQIAGSWPETTTETASASTAAQSALVEVEAALREATSAMLDDDSDMGALSERIKTLKAQRAELRAIPQTAERVTKKTGRTLAEAWAASDSIPWRRSVLLWGLDHVEIAPTTSRQSPIDPKRVTFFWQE